MNIHKDKGTGTTSSYHLSPRELGELHRKYGLPGEISPGRPAKKKRSHLDAVLAAMDRRDKISVFINDEDELPPREFT